MPTSIHPVTVHAQSLRTSFASLGERVHSVNATARESFNRIETIVILDRDMETIRTDLPQNVADAGNTIQLVVDECELSKRFRKQLSMFH